ncbi:MAG: hypothetical protein ACJAVC_001024 [Brevundimonas sp.]|jgi:hypothetical protein|uniref:hypothetical protein n=1 Tax=Brevundimonas sp. GW460-12-10-14-LB2 TaxID=1827469 RepID=UPI0007BC968A|nr:hypothetical protein [Brevundimonas sp. GW460-12-10-14-LB2]ANC54196.1 hypothetical protein A4249_11395 [Brevundimonas sp. GW460-12-10-14-LB2]MEA3473800.1 hypothetical protein [Pseudomonadota bacterium]
MSIRSFAAPGLALALTAAALSACAPTAGGGLPNGGPAAFNEADFGWSQMPGRNSIQGQIAFARDGKAFDCVASVGLTPDTPYTRARIRTLYGSTQRAAVPAAVVRARTVADANSDYRTYVRDTRCENGRFRFDGLPDGGWFLIVPVTSGDAPVVLMQSVQTRGGRVVSITL